MIAVTASRTSLSPGRPSGPNAKYDSYLGSSIPSSALVIAVMVSRALGSAARIADPSLFTYQRVTAESERITSAE